MELLFRDVVGTFRYRLMGRAPTDSEVSSVFADRPLKFLNLLWIGCALANECLILALAGTCPSHGLGEYGCCHFGCSVNLAAS